MIRAPLRWSFSFLLLLVGGVAEAQEVRCDPGDVEVARLLFAGNAAFPDAVLADGVVTTESNWARRRFRFFGTRRCLDRAELPRDVLRLRLWYRNHGFTDAMVDTTVVPVGRARVEVTFRIREGAPTLIDSLFVDGLEGVPERESLLRALPVRVGGRFDRYAIEATRDTITRRLRDDGYPDGETLIGYDTDTERRRAVLRLAVTTGVRRRIGEVRVTRVPRPGTSVARVKESSVLRLAGLSVGDLYRERALERAKRTLYQTEAFAQVSVGPDSTVSGDSLVPIGITVTEGFLRSARAGGGWGSLDCFRATGELTQFNLFGRATRLDLRGRVSKIGVGKPLANRAVSVLCPQANDDPYSENLNYYVGATVTQPAVLRTRYLPTLSLYSERRSEYNAYLRTTPVGASASLARILPRLAQSLGYTLEYGRTEAQPALFCAVFNACEAADREALQRTQRLGVLSAATSYDRTDDPLDPSRGVTLRLDARHALKLLGSDDALRFSRFTVDGASYVPLGRDLVFASRLRLGIVLGPTFALGGAAQFVPPQERLFAGGPTTVRGFRQNELGPAVYIPSGYDSVRTDGSPHEGPITGTEPVFFRANADSVSQRAVPTGGNTMLVGNFEFRLRSPVLPELLQWSAFTDVGSVWNRGLGGSGLGVRSLRWTPGLGVRVRTIIGFLRADFAYNPYRRPEGAAYFDTPIAEGGSLYCVSPGNTLAVTPAIPGVSGGRLSQASGSCPSTFQPPRAGSFLQRLTFNFSIGQAF